MQFVPIDNGRAWEWEHQGWRFRAVARNRSRVVTLEFRTAEDNEAEWTVSHERETQGRRARLIAEQMYRDTTGVPLDIMSQVRIQRTWFCDTGSNAGKFGVGLAPLYLTQEELEALQAAFGLHQATGEEDI